MLRCFNTLTFVGRTLLNSVQTFAPLVVAVFLFFQSLIASAEPLIGVGDEKTRHHLQVLADEGVLNISASTWPLAWSNVSYALSKVAIEDLSEEARWSYRYLRHAMTWAMKKTSRELYLHAASSPQVISDYSSESREAVFAELEVSTTRGRFISHFNATAVADPSDEEQIRFDGSYAAIAWGNWIFGGGSVDRWWGPGWQSSLILSQNARPSPGLFISRKNSFAPEWKLFRWIGPWDLTFFANQLEDKRTISQAKLLGGRLTLRPHRKFELGLSRTAQWGGRYPDGRKRPQNLSSLANLVLGRDNTGEDGINKENEPGNQLAGYDWRFSHTLWGVQLGLYHQRIGEDEKDNWIFQEIDLWGFEASKIVAGVHSRVMLEYIETRNESFSIYEHGVYGHGYRYYGRPIGAGIDTASKSYSIFGDHYFDNGHQVSWRFSNMHINQDESPRQPPGGSVFGPDYIPVKYLNLTYKMPLNSWLQFEGSVFHYDRSFEFADQTLESGAYLRLNAKF